MQKVRVVMVGLGAWGIRAHLPALVRQEMVDVVAAVDADPVAVAEAQRLFGIEHGFSKLEDCLRADIGVDAVVIATPDDTHHALVTQALKANIHVFCEKPLAYDVAQAVELAALARDRQCVSKMGFIFRFSPAVQRMKELVDEGYIGELQMFENLTVNAQFIDPDRPLHWKMTREHANGGVYVEYGVHAIDLALWLGGAIARIVASASTLVPERPTSDGARVAVDTDDACTWIGRYASGAEAAFRVGWASLPVGGSGMRLYGNRGSLAWEMDGSSRRRERLLATTLEQREPFVLYEYEPPYEAEIDDGVFPLGILARYNRRLLSSFIEDIRQDRCSSPTFEDGLAAQKVLAAIHTSLAEGRWADVAQG